MPKNHPKPTALANVATFSGMALIFGSLLLTLVFPRLHVGIAIAIGAALGAPLVILGLWLGSNHAAANQPPRSFWPTKAEAWGILGVLVFFACVLAPVCMFLLIAFFLPSGDDWGIVILRIVTVVVALGASIWWIKFASKTIPKWFPDGTIDAFTWETPAEEPKSAAVAAYKNWQIGVIAIVAFCVAFGVIDYNSPILNVDAGGKRARGFMRLITWCRGNPNTVTSSSALVGFGALGFYAFRIVSAAKAKKSASIPEKNPS
jgi:hypothetical protein